MLDLIRQIVTTLDDIAGIDCIWRRGLVHPGGPHYRLKGTSGPISLGEDECVVFGRIIEEFKPSNCFIIGNAFGMSSVFIAKMMEHTGGKSVVTLDSTSEGDGERCFETAAILCEQMDARLLTNKVGWSPQDVENAAEDDSYDLIFIDGDHTHPQVTKDFEGVKHLVGNETIVCWHDFWWTSIPKSVRVAQDDGFECLKINSSCEMAFGTKSPAVFQRLNKLFPDGESPRSRYRPLAWLKNCHCTLVFILNTYLLRRR